LLSPDDHFRRFRVRFAIKVTLASVVCALISFLFHLSFGYLSPLIVVLILVAFRDQVVKAGIPGFLSVLVAGGVALAICGVLVEAQIALVLCILGWLFLWMAFLVRIPLGRILGGILIAMALLTVAIGSGRPEDLVTAFWTQVFFGTVVAVAFDRLLWPPRQVDTVYGTLAAIFGKFAGAADELGQRLRSEHAEIHAPKVDLSDIASVSVILRHTIGGKSEAEFQLKYRLWLIWDRTQVLKRQIRMESFTALPDAFVSEFADIIADFARHYRELAQAALDRRPARRFGDDTRRKVENLVAMLRDVRFREPGRSDASVLATTLIRFMSHALDDHSRLADAYNAIVEGGSIGRTEPNAAPSLAELFTWPSVDDYKISAKVTLIILILLLGVLYLDFPGSTLVAFYGILFGLTVNLGQLYLKGMTGLLGMVVGLAYGLLGVLIVVQSPHLLVLLGVFALGTFVSVYVASGGERSTFMGLQAALLVPYVFLIFEGPEWTLSNAVTRVAALVVAAVVAVLVQRLIWPVDPLIMFRRATARALEALSVAWQRAWASGESGEVNSEVAAPEFPQALIDSFCRPAVWLRDSRYLVGSGHVAARRYARVLGQLEELLAELNVVDRLLRSNEDGALRDRAKQQNHDTIIIIAATFQALASFYRDPRNIDQLTELRARLSDAQAGSGRSPDFEGLTSIEDRRTASVLFHTIADVAGSLASAVDATVELLSVESRRPKSPRPRPHLAHASGN